MVEVPLDQRNPQMLFDGPLVAIPPLGVYHVSGEEM